MWLRWASRLTPPPDQTPDQWADAYRVLPASDDQPGPYRSARTPYVIGPGRACAADRWAHVWFIGFSQGGKTTIGLNVIGWRLHYRPTPCLVIEPTRDLCTGPIHRKLDGLLRNCPALWSLTATGKAYTTTRKTVAGVTLRTAWAGSDTEMAADSAGFVVVDEIDRCQKQISGEGGIIPRADARHSSYGDGLTLGISSPTLGNVTVVRHKITGLDHWARADPEQVPSAAWRFWQDGTGHEFAWPCPHCRRYFVPRFRLLTWESGGSPAQARRTAALACPHCEARIESTSKGWQVARGVYVAPGQLPLEHRDGDEVAFVADFTAGVEFEPTRDHPRVHRVEFGDYVAPEVTAAVDASFWCSGLAHFGARRTFGAMASDYVRAVRAGDEDEIQAVLNTGFGECFAFGGDAPDVEAVAGRKAAYAMGSVPAGVAALFLTVDVQRDRLHCLVRGWAPDEESWLVDRLVLWGDTSQAPVWRELDELLAQTWDGHRIARAAIDSGYRPDVVYRFVRARPVCLATKGHGASDRPFWASRVDVDVKGQVRKRGSLQLWHIDTDRVKSWVHAQAAPDPEAGAAARPWHVPGDTPDDYFAQLIAEERVVKPSGAIVWIRKGRNEDLDCEGLQVFLARKFRRALAGAARRRRPKDEGEESHPEPEKDDSVAAQRRTARRRPRRRASFVTKN